MGKSTRMEVQPIKAERSPAGLSCLLLIPSGKDQTGERGHGGWAEAFLR